MQFVLMSVVRLIVVAPCKPIHIAISRSVSRKVCTHQKINSSIFIYFLAFCFKKRFVFIFGEKIKKQIGKNSPTSLVSML